MMFAAELASFSISWAQELGIVVGVGAVTITLVGHLLSIHAHQPESRRRSMRVARQLRFFALAAIMLSGAAATLMHAADGTLGILVAPAFMGKWALIVLLAVFHFLEWSASGWKQDAVEGFEGANWYALLLIHTLAPVASWSVLASLYGGWMLTFGALWAVFVWIMRKQGVPALKAPPQPKPALPKPEPVLVVAEHKADIPATSTIEVPVPSTIEVPVPSKVEVHPNHSLLPIIAELDLPAPSKAHESAPQVQTPPSQTTAHIIPQTLASEEDIDPVHLPALQVMPQRPEDIQKSRRGPVVQLSGE